jgi:hypothetical protein
MKNTSFWVGLRNEMLRDRKIYLSDAHTKEWEVHTDRMNHRQWFWLDIKRVYIPEYLCSVIHYRDYKFSEDFMV